MTPTFVILAVLVLIALILAAAAAVPEITGGGAPRRAARTAAILKRPHAVVDTLNLVRWWGEPATTTESIIRVIDATAPALRRRFPGELWYVLKDRDSLLNTPEVRSRYQAAAERNSVRIAVAEKYADPPRAGPADLGAGVPADSVELARREHAERGRDDFYAALLAHRWRCPIITEDRLRDFDLFRSELDPFQVWQFSCARAQPERDFIRPRSAAYSRLPRPRRLGYEAAGLRQPRR